MIGAARVCVAGRGTLDAGREDKNLVSRFALSRLASRVSRLVFAAAVMFAAGVANAATWYWTGDGGDLNWFTPANWNSAADGKGDAATELASGDSFTFGSVVLTDIEVNYNPPSGNFAVGTVTFDAGVASVTVKGDAVASISAVVNKSSSDQIFENKVYFSGNIKTIKNGTGSIKYPGGAQGTYIDTSSGWQSDFYGNFRFTHTGEITPDGVTLKTGTFWEWPDATFYRHNGGIIVESGATGLVANAIIRAENKTLIGKVDGVFMITNNFSYTKAGTYSKFVNQAGTGDVVVRKVTNGSGRHMIPFLTQSEGRTIIGEGGVGNGDYCRVWDNGNTYHIGSYANWDISYYVDRNTSKTVGNAGIYKAGSKASTAVLMFDTTDYYDGSVGRKITSYSTISAETNPQYVRLVVDGIGTFAFANTANPWNLFSGGLIASNKATVAVHAGSRPGAGNVTMTGKTTLAVPESGTATVVGNLTMLPGTKLAFNFTSTATAPVLALGGTLALPSAGQNPVTVKVSANDGLDFNFDSEYAITSGGKFLADAVTSGKVVLSDDSPAWAKLYVNASGDLAVKVANYFYIKIAGAGDMDLTVPMQWLDDNGIATADDSIKSVADALERDGENGIPVWQSYCLGLEPTNSQSVVLCDATATQPADGAIRLTAKNLNIPEGLSSVAVKTYLDRKSTGDWVQQGEPIEVEHGTAVEFTADVDPQNALSFFV